MLMKWISILIILATLLGGYHLYSSYVKERQFKVIVFDFGSVIAKTDRQQVIHFIAQSLNISQTEAENALNQLKHHTSQNEEEPEFWQMYAEQKKIRLPDHWLEKLDDTRLHALKEIPGMIDLVKDLQKQGYQTALLSNVRGSQAAIKRKLGYYNLFSPVLLSYEIGIKKPDPKAYQLLLAQLKIPPERVLFIDNKQANVNAAKALGMDGIVFYNRDQLAQELKKRGIVINSS